MMWRRASRSLRSSTFRDVGRVLAFGVCSLLWAGDAAAQGRTVRVWLMPVEPAIDNPGTVAGRCEFRDLADFEARYGKDRPVTVLNVSDSGLRNSWDAVNPEFATRNSAMVAGQCGMLQALERFAADRHVRVEVQIVSWGQAFREITRLARDRSAGGAPDLMQIGSTWIGLLVQDDVYTPPSPPVQAADWYSVPGKGPVAIKYLTDHRLLFYWKRLEGESIDGPALAIDDSSWTTIVQSLEGQKGSAGVRPLVMPVGLNVNLLYDYLPLVLVRQHTILKSRVFGLFTSVDLASDGALEMPLSLAKAHQDRQASGREPLLAFPEMPHEEATLHFLSGEYRAIVEPVAFVKRWHDAFVLRAARRGEPAASFWDYAGVAVPPAPFQGGSGLMVVKGSRNATPAFELAQFLTSDPDYTLMLARYGQLSAKTVPAGTQALAATLDVPGARADASHRTAFIDAVERTVETSLEPPAIADWPTAFESTETLELVQRVWRRLGEGNERRVHDAATELEVAINRRIFWPATIWASIEPALLIIGAVLAAMATVVIGSLATALRKAKEAARSRSVRGFASIGLAKIETEHSLWHNEFSPSDPESDAGKRSALIMSVLRGWQRGADPLEWADKSLELVVWRAILLAIDSIRLPGLYERWEREHGSHPDGDQIEAFLRRYQIPSISRPGLLRDGPAPAPENPPFHFSVQCPATVLVHDPFLLEQALACLIQNAITASKVSTATFRSIHIGYDATAQAVSVSNEGEPFDESIRNVMNRRLSFEAFKMEVAALLPTDDGEVTLREPHQGKKKASLGLGLVEARCIAVECYRGLSIAAERPTVTIYL